MYRMLEIDGVLHAVRDMTQFDKTGGIVLDDTPVAVHLEDVDPNVLSIREQMEKLFAREKAQLQALRAEEESEEDEDDFDVPDNVFHGTSSTQMREMGQRIIQAAELLEREADESARNEGAQSPPSGASQTATTPSANPPAGSL